MSAFFQQKEVDTLIDGEAGSIELRINGLPSNELPKGGVVICHPHPLHGGTLDNKVVSTMARAYQSAGWLAVRFNFRGVGKSAGSYDDGRGELCDLESVVTWTRQQLGASLPLAVAGFSFGGAVAASFARDQPCVSHTLLISPAIGRYGFGMNDVIDCPVLLIQGEADEVLDPQVVYQWVESTTGMAVQLVRLPNAGHFYHGKLVILKTLIINFLDGLK